MRVGAPNPQRTPARARSGASVDRPRAARQGMWRTRRAAPWSAGQIAVRRLGSGWRMLLGVGAGILAAVVLTCTVPLYDNLITNVQVQATINQAGSAGRNVEVVAAHTGFSAALSQRQNGVSQADMHRYLGTFTQPSITSYLVTDAMLLASAGRQTLDVSAPNATTVTFDAFDYAQALPHMQLLTGHLPATSGSGVYDALITQQMAADLHLAPGDQVKGVEFGEHQNQMVVRVTGIWQPAQANDPYWNGRSFARSTSQTSGVNYPVLIGQAALTSAMQQLPDVSVEQHWIAYTQPGRINTGNLDAVQTDIGELRAHLDADLATLGAQVAVNTALDHDIVQVQQQLALLALPLYIIVSQVVALTLLFVLAMAGLLVESQTGDIATLKSRGASAVQMLGSYATQGMLVGLAALVAGPLLAGALALALVRAFVPSATLSASGASSPYLVALATPWAVAVPALVGALLGVAAVVAATQRATRLDVLAFRREQARSTRQPFWRRYYLDVGLAALCALGYLELGQFGGLGLRAQLGQAGSSPLLLAAPALLLLAGTLLLLRVFPVVAEASARWAARGRGVTSMLAFSQLARSSAGPSRLMLLLALSVGLGLFALTFDGSLVRNASDRAAYQAGADVRLMERSPQLPPQDARARAALSGLPGAPGVTPVFRGGGTTSFAEGYVPVNLLAVDPSSWAGVAGATSWRSDYADASLASLMAGMRAHQWGASVDDWTGKTGAGQSNTPVWAVISDTLASNLHVRVGDRFTLTLTGTSNLNTFFVVGAIVHEFPTLYPAAAPGGFVVMDLYDCLGAITIGDSATGPAGQPAALAPTQTGPIEYWLKTTPDPVRRAELDAALQQQSDALDVDSIVDRQALQTSIASNPLQSGMRGLLLVGALTAAALAVLGTIVQAAAAARQRVVQFAVLRTMGMASRQLTGLLLGEQFMVFAFGLLGGTVLGVVLATATLPFLQFGDTSLDPATLGVPPYVLAVDPRNLLWFYVTLLVACALALAVAARYAATIGLGKTLRLGED
jgi:ABC-type lipoprotein release transport system permease subunit